MIRPAPSLTLPKICVAVGGDDLAGQAAALVAHGFSFFEFRIDLATDPFEAVYDMGAFLRRHPSTRAVATCRRTANGGKFDGTAADEVEMLRQSIAVGAHIVDLSLETAEESQPNPHALAPLRRGPNALLLSWHDFHATPPLRPVFDRMRAIGADLFKLVPTATTLRDSFALVDLLREQGADGTLVAMSMGVPGMLTRILGPAFGSRFTFASAGSGAETAPGQIDAHTLRDLYRAPAITDATALYGVFGKPITGSRSPVMLNTAFASRDLDAVYLPFETDDADELFATFEHLQLAGGSITMPLKERILSRLSTLEPQARALGAANTIRRLPNDMHHGSHLLGSNLHGSNTDVHGILQPLEHRLDLHGRTALVLGAGGVARAAVFALQSRGSKVFLANRTRERAEALALATGATVLDPPSVEAMAFDVVLNGTPFGMPSAAAMAAPVDFTRTRCGLFFDLVYNPVETPLIVSARQQGIPVIPGVEMFLAQGAAQFQTWTGLDAPSDAMKDAVYASLFQAL